MPRTKLETWYLLRLKTLLTEYVSGEISFPKFFSSVVKMKLEFEERLLLTLEEENQETVVRRKGGNLLAFPKQEA